MIVALISGNYVLFCDSSVLMLRLALVIWSRTSLHTAHFAWFFVLRLSTLRIGPCRFTLNPAFIQVTCVDGYLRNFFVPFVLQHKGSDVPSAAHNVVYIINLCSLATQQVYTTSSVLFK